MIYPYRNTDSLEISIILHRHYEKALYNRAGPVPPPPAAAARSGRVPIFRWAVLNFQREGESCLTFDKKLIMTSVFFFFSPPTSPRPGLARRGAGRIIARRAARVYRGHYTFYYLIYLTPPRYPARLLNRSLRDKTVGDEYCR
ncbi:hypothetical protein EVAR_53635_1 [Eumeta japonica]|uniref:Uncharacterized protein n=1 Tax=Eumeta variegata TaxID=151549 RepID=A0A4C1WYX3_EUMVA|nr:hypothetical protein EVAR_53635_1 [Eumeta japonica]